MDYSSKKLLKNIANICFSLVIFLVLCFVMLIAKTFKRFRPIYDYLKENLILAYLIRLFLETFLIFEISAFISMQDIKWSIFKEKLNYVVTIFFIALTSFPFITAVITFMNRKNVLKKDNIGYAFYDSLNLDNNLALYYNSLFLLRRTIYSASIVML